MATMPPVAKVLVIDDAGFVRRWCRDVLPDHGHQVQEGDGGQKGLVASVEQALA